MTRMSNVNELRAIISRKIPMYDTIEPFNKVGMARSHNNGRVGVVNESYKLILPAVFKSIIFCKNSIIIAENDEGLFELFLSDGSRLLSGQFADLVFAKICAIHSNAKEIG